MGFFFRKSINVGPVRINLSMSGIGISLGVIGARAGTRPDRKKFIAVGRKGFFYRKFLTTKPKEQ